MNYKISRTKRYGEILANRANRHAVVAKCKKGDEILINDKPVVCIHRTSTGSFRFRTLEEPKEVFTYERSEMRKCLEAMEIIDKIDAVLKEYGY